MVMKINTLIPNPREKNKNQNQNHDQGPNFSPEHEKNLVTLAQQDMLRLSTGQDSDDFGRLLTAFEARQLLEKNQPLVVTHPGLGSLEKARFPEDSGRWWVGREVDPAVRDSVWNEVVRDHVEREGATISSAAQLDRYLVANGMASGGEGILSADESAAAASLRKFQGNLSGKFITVYSEDDFRDGYYFKTEGDHSDSNNGLYNPKVKKGGFLGLFGNQDRLSPYEAMEILSKGQPVRIVRDGKEATLNGFGDLQAYDRLS